MATVSIPVPTALIQPVLDRLDALKAKFLAVPANVRASLDKLARVRVAINASGNVPVEVNTAAMQVETNLKRVQTEWQQAAERFTQLDDMRRVQSLLNLDGVQLASSLALSAGYVLKNADASIRAVDDLAAKYLTQEQRTNLNVTTAGVVGGFSVGYLALAAGLYFAFFRRGRR